MGKQKRNAGKRAGGRRIWLLLHALWAVTLVWGAPALSQSFMPAALLTLGPPALYLAGSIIFLFGSLWQGWGWIGAHLIVAVGLCPPVVGYSLPLKRTAEDPFIKVATLNVAGDNADLGEVVDWIEREEVDVLCLQEVNGTENIAQQLLERLDGWHGAIRREVAVISRYPLGREQSIPMGGQLNRDILGVEVGAPRPIWVVSVHWPAPMVTKGLDRLAEDQESRRKYLEATLKVGEWSDWATVIAGDFNTPPRHGLYQEVADHYANAFSSAGRGLGYSFPSHRPVIRIDHLWLSPELASPQCHVGPNLGSDHLPVVAEISMKPAK